MITFIFFLEVFNHSDSPHWSSFRYGHEKDNTRCRNKSCISNFFQILQSSAIAARKIEMHWWDFLMLWTTVILQDDARWRTYTCRCVSNKVAVLSCAIIVIRTVRFESIGCILLVISSHYSSSRNYD